MTIKRRNHEVPRGLLRNWKGLDGKGRAGLHYYDLHDFLPKFAVGTKAFFAVTDYLYVPLQPSGLRDDQLENWLSIDESALAVLAKAAQDGRETSDHNVQKAIRACVALGYRSAYQMYRAGKLFARDEQVAKSGTVHLEMVRNAWEVFSVKFTQLLNWDFCVVYNLPVDLLINDRPFFDTTFRSCPGGCGL